MNPQRIQRQRTKGWRMPEGAVYVGRPTKWGNPFRLRTPYALARVPAVSHEGKPWEYEGRISADGARHDYHHNDGRVTVCHVRYMTAAEAVQCYRQYITGGGWPLDFLSRASRDLDLAELRGKDLACWCPLEDEHGNRVPCHADVLLELANPGWTP